MLFFADPESILRWIGNKDWKQFRNMRADWNQKSYITNIELRLEKKLRNNHFILETLSIDSMIIVESVFTLLIDKNIEF